MASEVEKRRIMQWLWDRMHQSKLQPRPDQLCFEGDHDLAYLYDCGFVDTDRHSKEDWIRAFHDSRQGDGSYRLTHEQWMAKEPYRYFGPVDPPFDTGTIREGEWILDEYKKLIKEKLLPETTVSYETFLLGFKKAQERGEIVDDIIVMTAEKKKKLKESLDRYASPRRRRALSAERVRRHEELETPTEGDAKAHKSVTPGPATSKKHAASQYKNAPDRQKQASGKLGDLLSGSKK